MVWLISSSQKVSTNELVFSSFFPFKKKKKQIKSEAFYAKKKAAKAALVQAERKAAGELKNVNTVLQVHIHIYIHTFIHTDIPDIRA